MKVLCFLLGYLLLASALCKAQPTGHFWSEPTDDPAVKEVLSTLHRQSLASIVEPRASSEPDLDASSESDLDASDELYFDASSEPFDASSEPDETLVTVGDLQDKYRYYNKDEKVFEHVYNSLCKKFPETDKTAWGVVVNNAYMVKSITCRMLDYADALEISLKKSPFSLQFSTLLAIPPQYFGSQGVGCGRDSEENARATVGECVSDMLQTAIQAQDGQPEHMDDWKMDQLVLSMLRKGDDPCMESLGCYFEYAYCYRQIHRGYGFHRFYDYIRLRSEDPSISRIDIIKDYLSELSYYEDSDYESSVFKALEKLETLHNSRMTITKVNRILKERNAACLDADRWMVKLLAGSPGMDQENIEIVFAKARALVNLELAVENSMPKAVHSLLKDHKSFPEDLFGIIVTRALWTPKPNVAIITMLLEHPSLSKDAFASALFDTNVLYFKNHFEYDAAKMIKLLLRNQHTHHFYNDLNAFHNEIKSRHPKLIFYDQDHDLQIFEDFRTETGQTLKEAAASQDADCTELPN